MSEVSIVQVARDKEVAHHDNASYTTQPLSIYSLVLALIVNQKFEFFRDSTELSDSASDENNAS